ncbi:MAG: ComEC/Rec2 family competence protein [Xanthobacteraceae bacterium]
MTTSARARVLGAASRAGLPRVAALAPDWRAMLATAVAQEIDGQRFFLWIPVAAMGGVALNIAADREPVLWLPALLTALSAALAWICRARPVALGLWVALAAAFAGFLSMGLRTERDGTPMLDHVRTVRLQGLVEEVDIRPAGGRFILRVLDAERLPARLTPHRVRLTTRKIPDFSAGDYVALTGRLWPPPTAALPGGYDFARDAYFEGVGAVGFTLGTVSVLPPPRNASWRQRFFATIDRSRNRLAVRVDTIIGGNEGAIAAAMVTGKRDFLSNDAKDLIREAGIFHIITISGLQMTLVAGIFFFVARRLFAFSPTLALSYPIKKWAAGIAMLGSLLYDIGTGSRVGTERALIMTLIVLGAIMLDRRALSMRNLALAVLAIVALEPDAILGVSFQLSFAAVAALIAAREARFAALDHRREPIPGARDGAQRRGALAMHLVEKPLRLVLAAFCATSATASFMAYHFHDLSPYVLIGNPLTLAIIECFAVPGALLGTALYPLGLDAPVWHYVGFGISFILWVARFIAAAPGSTLHVRAFAPYALTFLSLAVMSAVLWRSWLFRAGAIPLAALGIIGALNGPRYDVIIPPSGDLVAVRGSDGNLQIVGKHFNGFTAEQWLEADGDDRAPATARSSHPACDRTACIAALPAGRTLSVVSAPPAFEEDCVRAAVVVSSLPAPIDCSAQVFDSSRLAQTGAVGLTWNGSRFVVATDRSVLEDRPWSPAPLQASERVVVPPPSRRTPGADPADQ